MNEKRQNIIKGQSIIESMIVGYGAGFPSLDVLFDLELTNKEASIMKAPIPGIGRYHEDTEFLQNVTSAQAIGLTRFHVMREYFIALSKELADYTGDHRKVVRQLTEEEITRIRKIGTIRQEVKMAEILERFTEHDTAAAGDLMKLIIAHRIPMLASEIEGMCFACTSEDTMSNVFGLISNELVFRRFLPALLDFCDFIISFIHEHGGDGHLILPELTHEQPAEATTLDQKMAVRLYSILYCISQLQDPQKQNHGFKPFSGKLGGAIGDLKCHYAAYPDIDWHKFACNFVKGLGLYYHPFTDQCVSYVLEAQHFKTITNILTQIIKLADDFVKMVRCPGQLFIKEKKKGTKGSSIMPTKSNLWQIEGAIAMLKEARVLLNFFAEELQSYPEAGNMERSYLFRNIGSYFMPAFIALARIRREMSKCHPNQTKIDAFFNEYPGMSGSVLQTVMKRIGISGDAYRTIQDIAINADGSYANAKQFQNGLEQKMEELQLEPATQRELRRLLEPAYLVQPMHEDIKRTLTLMAAQIQLFKGMAKDVQGLPLID